MENKVELLEAAISVARMAGKVLNGYFRDRNLAMQTKLNVYDVVTTADKDSENLIISFIRDSYPDHGIIAEETGSSHPGKEYVWIIDPLDGTTNFSQGIPFFCVSIAIEYRGEGIVGVVYAPYLDELFYATKDGGAFHNGKQIKCSKKHNIDEAVVSTGFPYDKRENRDNNLSEFSRVMPYVRGIRRLGSAALDLSYVAAGFLDAFWELNLKHWDVAAGTLICRESGAKLTSIRENRNFSILSAAPGLFDSMQELIL